MQVDQGNRIKIGFSSVLFQEYSPPMETASYFSSVHDPRVVGRCKHKLSDILMVALITYLFGGDDHSDMYQLCHYRGEEFKPLLKLPNGCPSEDTFERVMQAVHPDEIVACLEVYTS